MKSIASKCAPYDFTGVDLSTISAVPCEGEECVKEIRHEPGPEYRDAVCDHKAGIESNITPPDTPFRSPVDYGCDFATVTCSTPYTDLDKPRKLSVRNGHKGVQKPNLNQRFTEVQLPDIVMETELNGLGVSPVHSENGSPKCGIRSLTTPGVSEADSKHSGVVCTAFCDQHHSNCACGIIGHISPPYTNNPLDIPFGNLNVSHYDNIVSPHCEEMKESVVQKKSLPKLVEINTGVQNLLIKKLHYLMDSTPCNIHAT